MIDILSAARKDAVASAAAVVVAVGGLTIGGFFFFQYVLGYPPCPLCLDQRMAFYAGVPLAALLWLGAGHGAARKVLFDALECRPVGVSRRRRMEVLAGAGRLFGTDQRLRQYRRYAQAIAEHPDRALR